MRQAFILVYHKRNVNVCKEQSRFSIPQSSLSVIGKRKLEQGEPALLSLRIRGSRNVMEVWRDWLGHARVFYPAIGIQSD